MRTCIAARREFSNDVPDALAAEDVRLSEQVLHYVLERYSAVGSVVFDPFAGFGTTLLVAERLGRIGYGIERERERWAYAWGLLRHPERLLLGDVRALRLTDLPGFALSVSSPVYMHRDEEIEPLSGFAEAGSYRGYIAALAEIYGAIAAHSQAGGHLVIEAANLRRDGVTTLFAWDLAQALASRLDFAGELVFDWGESGYGAGYTHSYGLVFRT